MDLLTKLLKVYNASGLRGSYRLTNFLANRLKSLQDIAIETSGGIIYADLRISSARAILANPRSLSGEDKAMQTFVKDGDIVFDIGAHFGLYTLILSELVGRKGKVFAFEPNIELLPSLRKTIKAKDNIELFEVALSDHNGKASLFVPQDASMASLSDWTNGNAGSVHTVECEMRKLDDLVDTGKLMPPQFIKCDVEGAELSVFKGAFKLLNRVDAPILMFEVNAKAAHSFGIDVKDYFALLESFEKAKYNFFEVLPNEVKFLEERELEFTNVIAVPEAKVRLNHL